MRQAGKVYRSGRLHFEALREVNLEVAPGDYLAILGPSGSGKSTLMNIIGCLDRPTSGHYFFEGHDVSELTDDGLAMLRNRRIGFVFQSFNLLPRLDILENVELPLIYQGVSRRERRELALAQLEVVGLADWRRHLPTEISGGQKQRVAIARALVTRPGLLLADEPTGNLDSRSAADIMEVLEEIHQAGRTVILITHDAQVAARARRQVHIIDGHLTERPVGARPVGERPVAEETA
ncbi:MAG: ABC transporter ATP-binding protein [Bacillota bacterium]|nr:ABC transporter ATP-binding protein [Bacillota bacterium]